MAHRKDDGGREWRGFGFNSRTRQMGKDMKGCDIRDCFSCAFFEDDGWCCKYEERMLGYEPACLGAKKAMTLKDIRERVSEIKRKLIDLWTSDDYEDLHDVIVEMELLVGDIQEQEKIK